MRSSLRSGTLVLVLSLFLIYTTRVGLAQEAAPATDATQKESGSTEKSESKPADDPKESANGKSSDSQPAKVEKAAAEKPATDKQAGEKEKEAAKDAEAKKVEVKKEEAKKDDAGDKKKEEKKAGVRLLALSGDYVDLMQSTGFDPFSLAMGAVPIKQKSFFRLCEYLTELGKDEDIHHVVFDLSDSMLGMDEAQLDEFERRLTSLKASGTKTYAWLENASTVHLSIAAFCDEVIMADFGGVDFPSVALQSMYYRDAMDLVGVQASVVRAGDYKGAVEPYTTPTMSEHLKRHYVELLESMNSARLSRVAKGRGLTTAAVREIQKQRFLTPPESLAKGLVGRLAPYGGMKKAIEDIVGEPTEWSTPDKQKQREMSFFEVMSMMMSGPKSSGGRTKDNTIAVFHLDGIIIDGKVRVPGSIVAGPTVKDIQTIMNDEKIKGVVLRVNSPGGSATASESIRQALKKLAETKPTVISMGRVAASGGYWISSIGVPVYAERATITGSIGVFSMKLSFGPLMRRVGVNLESITLDDSAAAFSIDRPWSEADISTLSKTVDLVYDRFLDLVSKSRGLTMDKLKTIAGGRVWSGTQAKSLGLVDEIGGLDECVAVIAKKAKLDTHNVIHRPTRGAGISILELLGETDENEVFQHQILAPLKMLARQGFQLQATQTLLKDGTTRTQGMPTVWLLNEAELSIK